MKAKLNFRSFLPFLIALLVFIVVTLAYFSPLLNGQTLSLHDVNMGAAASQEIVKFHDETGEWSSWTNSMFGGMPTYMIAGEFPYSITSKLGSFLYGMLPVPLNIFLVVMLCFYLFMRVLKVNNWISIMASIAFAFGTYNLIYVEAGHVSKVLAIAYLPTIMAGFILIFRRKYLLGTLTTAFFLGMELYANHIQITYYFFFVLLIYSVYELILHIKAKEYQAISKIALSFLVSVIIGVGMHTQRIWSAAVYSAETTRGVSELSEASSGKTGLDKEYAFAWSYGISETLNLIIPDLTGGGSVGALDESSETYKLLTSSGVDAANSKRFVSQLPLYHGEQKRGTAGPAYSGVIIAFLFILGLFIIENKRKWLLFGILTLLIMLSWGGHFSVLNYWVFDHIPGYNKFRSVSMILTIVHFILVWGAALTLNELLSKKQSFEKVKKPLLYSLGILFALMLVGYFSVDFIGINDNAFLANLKGSLGDNLANQSLNALRNDRATMALNDIYRGIILLLIVAGALYMFAKQKVNASSFALIMLVLVVFDMISVGKRYFNNDDFQPKFRAKKATFEPTAADQQILADTDPNFRVINLSTSFMSDARDSYFHKSLGGYHAAKLKKYNELVENQLTKDGGINMGVVNMLNTKYFINNTVNGIQAQLNQGALGNAWFIDSLIVVPTADEELELTGSLNSRKTAVTRPEFMSDSKTYQSNGSIELVNYAPNKLVYKSNSVEPGFAVFSEIFYRGNIDWLATVDGVTTDHLKVNYLLRGMEVPAGEHEIIFEFKPKTVSIGKKVDLASSIGLILLLGAALFMNFRSSSKD